MKDLLTIITFCLSMAGLKGQSSFELLFNMQGDTMLSGFHAIEDDNKNTYVLSNVDIFYFGTPGGIPIEGYLNIGSAISKLGINGDFIFSNAYNINWRDGTRPATEFYLNSQNDIVIPYIGFSDFLPCGDGSYFPSDKKNVLKLSDSGDVLDITDQSLDTQCSWDIMVSSGLSINDEVLIFRQNWLDDNQILYLDTYNNNLVLINTDTVFNLLGGIFYDKYNEVLVTGNQSGIKTYTLTGELIDEFPRPPEQIITTGRRTVFMSQDFYAVVIGGKYNTTDSSYVTDIFILDKNGNLIAEKIIDGVALDRGVFGSNNLIYLLADNSHYNEHDSIPLPVKVAVLDLNLNILGEKDFGFPFVSTNSITATQDGFLVAGTRFKSYDVVNGKEKDQAYILKGTLDQLVGIKDNKIEKTDLSIYPNPAQNHFSISNKGNNKVMHVEIRNLAGQLVIQMTPENNRVNISDLKPGIYLVTVKTNQGSATKKLIKL